jgi:hypothetical protein
MMVISAQPGAWWGGGGYTAAQCTSYPFHSNYPLDSSWVARPSLPLPSKTDERRLPELSVWPFSPSSRKLIGLGPLFRREYSVVNIDDWDHREEDLESQCPEKVDIRWAPLLQYKSQNCPSAHQSTPLFLAIYASMIYTAPCVMFLTRADTLRGQVGGGSGPGNRECGCHLGDQKTRDFQCPWWKWFVKYLKSKISWFCPFKDIIVYKETVWLKIRNYKWTDTIGRYKIGP